MIVRIMGEGQYVLGDAVIEELQALDDRLETCFEHDDEAGFEDVRDEMLALVRTDGSLLDAAEIAPSDVILPTDDATIEEVRLLLGEKGLVPG